MRAALLAAFALLSSAALAATDAEKLRGAVSYFEHPAHGGAPAAGRALPSGQGSNGVDVDSIIKVRIDRAKVVEAIAGVAPAKDDAFADLRARIEVLTRLSRSVEDISGQQQRLVAAFRNARADPKAYAAALRESSSNLLGHLDALRAAVRARAVSEGKDAAAAERVAADAEDAMLEEDSYELGFARAYRAELQSLEEKLEQLIRTRGEGIGVEVRAHLYTAGGAPAALRLLNYNQEAAGAARPFARVAFELTQQERDAYAAYEKLGAQVGQTRDAAEAVKRSFELAYADQIALIRSSFVTVATNAEATRAALSELAAWAEPAKLGTWLEANAAASRPELAPLRALLSDALALRQEIEALATLKATVDALPSMTPVQAAEAVTSLLETSRGLLAPERWKARRTSFDAVAAALPGVPAALKNVDGPFKAFEQARATLTSLIGAGVAAAANVKSLLAFLQTGAAATLVAEAPEPKLQRRLGIEEALDTEFDLQRAAGRNEDDTVVVNYRFFVEDRSVAEWEDRFVLRSYGVRSATLASLSFWARDTRDKTWNPSPAVSWVVTYRTWPGAKDNGLPSFWTDFIGVGVTALTVDYDPNNGLELGVAGTVSLFRHFLQVGYGVNLQAVQSPGFWFFAIRPLELGGLFGSGRM